MNKPEIRYLSCSTQEKNICTSSHILKITFFVLQTFLSSVVSCIQVVEAGFLDNKLSLTVEDVCSMPVLEAHNTSSMGLNLMAHLPSIVRGFKPSLVTGKSSQELRNSDLPYKKALVSGSNLNVFNFD